MRKELFRIACRLLAAVVLLTLLPAGPAFAADSGTGGKLSLEEAQALLNDAYALFKATDLDASEYLDESAGPVMLERNGRRIQYYPGKGKYAEYSYWKEAARKVYTDDLAEYALDHGLNTDTVSGIFRNEDGKVYFMKDKSVLHWSWFSRDGLILTRNSETEATGIVRGYYIDWDFAYNLASTELDVKFTKTADGWRISGGQYADYMCPAHQSERSRPIMECGMWKMCYNNHYLYEQIAKQNVQEFFKEITGQAYEMDVYLYSCSTGYEMLYIDPEFGRIFGDDIYYKATVLVHTPALNQGNPFMLCMKYEGEDDKWSVDAEASVEAAFNDMFDDRYVDYLEETYGERASVYRGVDGKFLCDLLGIPAPAPRVPLLSTDVASEKLEAAIFAYRNLTVSFGGYDESGKTFAEDSSFILVRDGYRRADMEQIFDAVFTREIAARLKETALHHYRQAYGNDYFRGGFAAQQAVLGYTDSYDVSQNIRIGENDAEHAVVFLSSDCELRDEQEYKAVTVYFRVENGEWKISGCDYRSTLLNADTMRSQDTLDEETARNNIVAAVYDLYYYTRMDSTDLALQKMGNESVQKDGKFFIGVNSGLETEAAWREYAAHFCTEEMVSRLLTFDKLLTVSGGKVFTSNRSIGNVAVNFHIPEPSEKFCKIEPVSSEEAVVYYQFHYTEENQNLSKELRFEFVKTEDGWKIKDGDFIDVLDGIFASGNPYTADGCELFVAFTVLVLATSVVFDSLKKRRLHVRV